MTHHWILAALLALVPMTAWAQTSDGKKVGAKIRSRGVEPAKRTGDAPAQRGEDAPIRRRPTAATAKKRPTAAAPNSRTPGDSRQSDYDAISKSIASYVNAFNAGDAEALAAHWAINGSYVNRETGEQAQGREAIKRQFAEMLAAGPRPRLKVRVDSLRFVTSSVAVEEGVAILEEADGGASESAYTAIHVKDRSGWKVDSIRETARPAAAAAPSNYDRLKELEWMIGEWVDEGGESTISTSCQWTKNRNFITRSFKASVAGSIELEGTQVIGWDPRSGSIRSWIFDSDGGFGEGTWTRNGNQWTVKTSQVLADGSIASSVNVFTYGDQNAFTWRSFGRRVGDSFLPNVGPVTVVRK